MYYTTSTTTGESWTAWAGNYIYNQTVTNTESPAVYMTYPAYEDEFSKMRNTQLRWISKRSKERQLNINRDELMEFL